MTTIPTTYILDLASQTRAFSDVRCLHCGKLICRWMQRGIAALEIKCPRCGFTDIVNLST